MRNFAAFTVAGVAGLFLFKLFATLVFPLLGLFLGLMFLTVKFAVIAAVVFFVYSLLRKRRNDVAA